MKMLRRVIAVAFVLAVAGLYVAIYVIPDVRGALRKTAVLEYGSLSISDEVTVYIVRDETVYMASRAGEIRYYVGEGVKVRKGVKLLDIVGGSAPQSPVSSEADADANADAGASDKDGMTALISRIDANGVVLEQNAASETGVVSYYIDGRESVFSFENLPSLTREVAAGSVGQVVNVTRHDGYVAYGEPIYKLTDNTQWRMVFWFDKNSGSIVNYRSGGPVTARMQNGDVDGRIESVVDQGDAWMIVLGFDRHYEDLSQLRSAVVTVVVADYRGLLVDNGSIAALDGAVGVYARQKNGDFKFVPVNVVRSDGARSIISMSSFVAPDGKEVRTVNIYEEILSDPGQFGQ
jgi:putative membrane fusion protein